MWENLAATGGLDGAINVIDIGKHEVKIKLKLTEEGEGVTRMLFSKIHNHILYVGSTYGSIYIFDIRNGEITKTLKGHVAPVMEIVENVTHNVLISAGDDRKCLVFQLI